jgi:hypothetical protein
MVILVRTLKMYQNDPKHWFRKYCIVMSSILTIGAVGGSVTAYMNFANGLQNAEFPIFRVMSFLQGIRHFWGIYVEYAHLYPHDHFGLHVPDHDLLFTWIHVQGIRL